MIRGDSQLVSDDGFGYTFDSLLMDLAMIEAHDLRVVTNGVVCSLRECPFKVLIPLFLVPPLPDCPITP